MLRRTILAIAVLAVGIAAVLPVRPAVAQSGAPDNDYWWPNRLSLDPLREASRESNPLGEDFNYREAFERYCQVDVERANLSRRADFLCSHRTAQVTSCQTMKARSRSSR